MAIEIKELYIKVKVGRDSFRERQEEKLSGGQKIKYLKIEHIIDECTERILELLEEKKDR